MYGAYMYCIPVYVCAWTTVPPTSSVSIEVHKIVVAISGTPGQQVNGWVVGTLKRVLLSAEHAVGFGVVDFQHPLENLHGMVN